MENKLVIAGAGAGKTKYIIDEALKKDDKVLITTFTINCKNEIIGKINKIVGYVPKNIIVQTWFSFILQHGIKPYKKALTNHKVNGINMVTSRSGFRFFGGNRSCLLGRK